MKPSPKQNKSTKFVITDTQASKNWPAWKGTNEQVRIDIKLGHGEKAKHYHLYVPQGDTLAEAAKGMGITISLHGKKKWKSKDQ
jgi:hypothetical protein